VGDTSQNGKGRLGHVSIQIIFDTYIHVALVLQEAAARTFDDLVTLRREEVAIEKIG